MRQLIAQARPVADRIVSSLKHFLVQVLWPATKKYGPPIARATANGFIPMAKLLLLPITIIVTAALTSTVVGQLLLASIALWIATTIFRVDILAFMKNMDGDIKPPRWIEWITPDFMKELLEEHPERLLELLDIFAI